MKHPYIKKYIIIAFLLFGALGAACKKKTPPSPEVVARYEANALMFCKAITGCMKKALSERLKDEPERRKMALSRMNRELCRKNQLRLLASLQADPRGPQPQGDNPGLYESYEGCARKLSALTDCTKIREAYDHDPDCRRVRSPSHSAN